MFKIEFARLENKHLLNNIDCKQNLSLINFASSILSLRSVKSIKP